MSTRTNTIISIVAVCLAILCGFLIQSRLNTVKTEDSLRNNLKAAQDTIKYHVDKEGILHATIQGQLGTINVLRSTTMGELDSASKRLQIDRGQIDGLQKVNARLRISLDAVVNNSKRGDTVSTVDKSDPFNDFHEVITVDSDGVETAHIADTANVPIHITEHSSRKNWFADKLHYVDAYSDNPNVRITGLQSVLVVREKPKVFRSLRDFAIGVGVGVILHLVIK